MKQTKQKVIDAAISLFNTKGYDGTSVRDIAKRADVNVANISYYFAGKQGLLEQLITDFLEASYGLGSTKWQAISRVIVPA
ncbi:TetR family transcriptional regulator, partial [Bacillus sp. HC-Mk]